MAGAAGPQVLGVVAPGVLPQALSHAASLEGFQERPMYGGAMRMVLPASFIDVSQMRDVPDHQEVWSDAASSATSILELTEVTERDGEELLRFHFEELARANGCAPGEFSIQSMQTLEDADLPGFTGKRKYGGLVMGEQHVAKFNEAAKNRVAVCIAVVRLPPPAHTDILLSINLPIDVHPDSSETKAPTAAQRQLPPPEELIRLMVWSLKVDDYGLFVPMEQD